MRLMNVDTYELEEFSDENQVEYAILSHRWEKEEVLFEHVQHRSLSRDIQQQRYGWNKVKECCRQARNDGHQWVWIDTCCINKESSAELQEAINSMYKWYQTARICYVYLSDVEDMQSFSQSQWFTRGWTLQELVAPVHLQFYGRDWNFLGAKIDLATIISHITKIDLKLLAYPQTATLSRFWNCEIMSWAANRQTTRTEDRAYSLFGLFDVNLPLLYGEGEQAFRRLQIAIMSHSPDLSLFAWCGDLHSASQVASSSLLASSPDDFSQVLYDSIPRKHDQSWSLHTKWKPYAAQVNFTNAGIAIKMRLQSVQPMVYFATLFEKRGSVYNEILGIYLRHIADNVYKRVRYETRRELFPIQRSSGTRLQNDSSDESQHMYVRSILVVDDNDPFKMRVVGRSVVVPTTNIILQDHKHHLTVFSTDPSFYRSIARRHPKATHVPYQVLPGIFHTIAAAGNDGSDAPHLPFHEVHLALDCDFMLTCIVVVEEKDSNAQFIRTNANDASISELVSRILSLEPRNEPFAPLKFEVTAKQGGKLRLHPRGIISSIRIGPWRDSGTQRWLDMSACWNKSKTDGQACWTPVPGNDPSEGHLYLAAFYASQHGTLYH